MFQHDSASMQRWSIIMILAVMFTAIVTPVEVALFDTSVNAMFWINRVVDVIFLCDIVINFRYVPTFVQRCTPVPSVLWRHTWNWLANDDDGWGAFDSLSRCACPLTAHREKKQKHPDTFMIAPYPGKRTRTVIL